MKNKDQILLEALYKQMYESVLIPRRTPEERQKNYAIAFQKIVQEYIKNGSRGDLDLSDSPNFMLPEGLTVNGKLTINDSKITSLPKKIGRAHV